jgi:hypothetical protein
MAKRAEVNRHDEQAVLRPEAGTQAPFKKRREPKRYRYDDSLSPALDWDGRTTRGSSASGCWRKSRRPPGSIRRARSTGSRSPGLQIGDDRRRFADARGLKAFAGPAPITRASGRSTSVTHRRVKKTAWLQSASSGHLLPFRDPAPPKTTTNVGAPSVTGTPRPYATSSIDSSANTGTAFKANEPTTKQGLEFSNDDART